MLKKLTSDQLIPGKKYLVEMKLIDQDKTDLPYCFEDMDGGISWLPDTLPIYALEPATELTDNDKLKMVVAVATALYVAHGTTAEGVNKFMPDRDQIAREALDLIQACKDILNEKA